MTIAIVGPAGAGATAVAPALQPPAPSTTAAATAEDKVTLSAAAQEVPQPMSMQVLALHNQGQSVAQIATQLSDQSKFSAELLGHATAHREITHEISLLEANREAPACLCLE